MKCYDPLNIYIELNKDDKNIISNIRKISLTGSERWANKISLYSSSKNKD